MPERGADLPRFRLLCCQFAEARERHGRERRRFERIFEAVNDFGKISRAGCRQLRRAARKALLQAGPLRVQRVALRANSRSVKLVCRAAQRKRPQRSRRRGQHAARAFFGLRRKVLNGERNQLVDFRRIRTVVGRLKRRIQLIDAVVQRVQLAAQLQRLVVAVHDGRAARFLHALAAVHDMLNGVAAALYRNFISDEPSVRREAVVYRDRMAGVVSGEDEKIPKKLRPI